MLKHLTLAAFGATIVAASVVGGLWSAAYVVHCHRNGNLCPHKGQ